MIEPQETKQCDYRKCDVIFAPNTTWQRFHTDRCRRLYRQDRKSLELLNKERMRIMEEINNISREAEKHMPTFQDLATRYLETVSNRLGRYPDD